MGMGGNGSGNDSMGVGREWEQESHSRTPLMLSLPVSSRRADSERVDGGQMDSCR